jgi:hypothetical protein
MNYRCCSVVALLALAILIAPGPARGDIITPVFWDGFEGDQGDVLNSTLLKWNVTSGSIDVLSAGNLCGPSGNYSNCVDLDGTGALSGTMQTKQTFALDATTYRLSFDLAGSNRPWGSAYDSVTVTLGNYYSETFTLFRTDPFQTFVRDIALANIGSGKIGFATQGNDMMGLLLDNVSLSRITFDEVIIPTPEPGAWELLLSAVMGLAIWRFRGTAARLMVRG